MKPWPILKWKDAAEKERAIRALYALGYRRLSMDNVDYALNHINHSVSCYYIFPWIYKHTVLRCNIEFSQSSNPTVNNMETTLLVNSVDHMISYLKNNPELLPKKYE